MKKFLFMAVAAIAALSSCSSDNDLTTGETGKKALTFTATMEGSATRATYNSTEKCAEWEKGDQISVNGKTYNAQSAGLTTNFTATTPGQEAGEAPYKAYFACTYDGTTATLPSAVSETWADGKFNMPMYATSSNTNLEFYNLCGVLKITVKNDQIDQVKKIKVSSANKAVSGTFTVTNKAAVLSEPNTVSNTLTVTYADAVTTTEGGKVFYVAVPAQDYRKLRISLSADGTSFTKTMTTKSDADITVARNKIYPITFAENAAPATTGTAQAIIDGFPSEVKWVQLWAGGPKFADRNVGASKVADYGDRKTFTEASAEPFFWGENWRTPIRADMEELFNAASKGGSTKVKCEYGNVDGVWGFTFTGKETGYTTNSVFLPCFADLSSNITGKTSYWVGPAVDYRSAWQMELALDVNKNYWGSRWINQFFPSLMYVRPVLSGSNDSDLPTGMAFTATMESDIDNSSEKCTPWKWGDLISINGKTYRAQDEGLTTPLNPVTQGQVAEGDEYTAYFPATLYNNGTPTLPSVINEVWTDGKFNMPMYATSSNNYLEFKNLCGLLKITVKGDWIDKVKKIRVSSANKAFSGAFTITDNAAVLTNPTTVANTLTVTYMDAVPTTAEGVAFYVAVPAQTYQQLKIELSVDGSSFTESMTIKEGDIVVERNKIYPITFRNFVNTPGLSENTPFGF
ncbi:MAG: hypothetical protein KBT39_10150 [Bacteroidales bacterium]|nr:hypothetical protein [Bacteroidales bacterium]